MSEIISSRFLNEKLFVLTSPFNVYAQERNPNKATLAKVIPTPNNGFAELVPLQRDQVSLHISSNAPRVALIENMALM